MQSYEKKKFLLAEEDVTLLYFLSSSSHLDKSIVSNQCCHQYSILINKDSVLFNI